MAHKIREQLLELGLIRENTVEPYFPRVRDRDDIAVLRDTESGVIFLDQCEHMDISHYEEIEGGLYWQAKDRTEALKLYAEDDARRATQFESYIKGKDFVDVGCGTGGILDYVKPLAKSVAGVEPQRGIRDELVELGYVMHRLPVDMPESSYDVASLFHTLEHLTDPLETLREIKRSLRPDGTLIVEVPHARDVLISTLDLEVFKKFTFWSEHLILHTRESLTKFLNAAGFSSVEVKGFQRYPLANHLYWLAKGEPGGQKHLSQFRSPELDEAYAYRLDALDQTDTLIAIARVY
jgi:SAM-dependent methyltransferase